MGAATALRMTQLPVPLSNVLLLLLAVGPLAGCAGDPAAVEAPSDTRESPSIVGERFEHGCPAGESCDGRADGAGFSGSLDLAGLATTAVGGAQRVSIAVLPSESTDGAPGELSVTSSDAGIFVVEDVVEVADAYLARQVELPEDTLFPQARVRGVGEGSAHLVLRSDDGLLVDRLELSVRELAEVDATLSDASDGPGSLLVVMGRDAAGGVVVDRDLEVRATVPMLPMDTCYFCFTSEERVEDPFALTVVFAGRAHDVVASP